MAQFNVAIVPYFGKPMLVGCDRKCHKAWGINSRPRVQLSDDDDDYADLADDELGEAPADLGTYEGCDGKPTSPDEFPNKWCVRECERCAHGKPDDKRLSLPDYSKRVYNLVSRNGSEAAHG